jgi:ABC-type amino acid transport substrate-binding protein
MAWSRTKQAALARLRCVALLAASTVLLAGAAHADLAEIQKQGSLRVLIVLDVPRPEFFALDATRPGFDREVLEGFARLHGLKLEVITLASFDDLIPALVGRKGDVIAGGYRDSLTRRKSIAFTAEVFPNRMLIINRKPNPVVRTVEQLRKERVGATRGTATAEALTASGVPQENVDDRIPFGGYVEALRSGRVTAAVWSVERALLAQREDPALQLGMSVGKPGSLAFGVRNEDTELVAALNLHIDRTRKSGTWSRLVVKYFGQSALQILQEAALP